MAPTTEKLLKQLNLRKDNIDLIVIRSLRGSVTTYTNYMGTSGAGDVE